MQTKIFAALDALNKFVAVVVALALAVMVAIVFWQVVVRFALPRLGLVVSAPWTEEVARYLMIWSIFLGGAVAARRGMLIAVTVLVEAVPEAIGRHLRALGLLVTAAFLLALIWYGWQWMRFGADETSPVLAISKMWLYLAMPVGASLGFMNLAALLVDQYRARPHWAPAAAIVVD